MLTTRKPSVKVTIVIAVGLFALGVSPLVAEHRVAESGPAEARDFSMIVLPDTQSYHGEFGIFTLQTSWINEVKDALDVRFVLHEGDIVSSPVNEGPWRDASLSLGILDDSVPYILNIGNHDMGEAIGSVATRDKHWYNAYFPASRYECQPWYGGRLDPDVNADYYTLFEVDDLKFLIISLEFGPDDRMLEWANTVFSNKFDRRTIVLTHCYTNYDDTRVGPGDFQNPHEYLIDEIGTNDGEEMWEKFVRRHPNIFLVLSGHIHGYGQGYEAGRLTSIGDHGNSVHQLLANYQNAYFHLGDGWLRILSFIPSENRISVSTYSPLLDNWMTDDENDFDLHYDMGALPRDGQVLLHADEAASSRYLTVTPNPGARTALRVNLKHAPLSIVNATGWWVGSADSNGRARLQDEPICLDRTSDKLHIYGPEILADSEYTVRAVLCDCPFCQTDEVTVRTCKRGDVDCDGNTDIQDVAWTVDAVKSSTQTTRCDQLPDGSTNVLDVAATVDAVKEVPSLEVVPFTVCDN